VICPKCKLDILNNNTYVIADARRRAQLERLRKENQELRNHVKGMNRRLAKENP
jgi:hypothetical protein